MAQNERYQSAKEIFAKIGVDTEAALAKLQDVRISMHCWQADDVHGFEGMGALTGGIQTTGNYPGRATTPEQLMQDFDVAAANMGGKLKLNLHASYAIFADGEYADRDALEPRHFAPWVAFAKERGMGIDFNPTFFSHPKAASFTLSSPDEEIRHFWVEHGRACLRIAEYFATETGIPCVMNIWIPDGYKDIPADRIGPRARFAKSLDEILDTPYDHEKVYVCLESKVFGIGLESYTVGSAEFTLSYAAKRGIMPLMDNGHYHPTEVVSDKISSLLQFNSRIGLHITRSVRWDSDHVVRLDDETREIAKEIVASGRVDDFAIALDYFDASINRVAAWTVGARSVRKALLDALLMPHAAWKQLQDAGRMTELMVAQEEWKTMPFGEVWNEFCRRAGIGADGAWLADVLKYEKEVLLTR
jgi:L-rhamnose isomerase